MKEEKRLLRWLNDEWEDFFPYSTFGEWSKHAKGKGFPDAPDQEDMPARLAILSKFLPLLRRVCLSDHLEEEWGRGAAADPGSAEFLAAEESFEAYFAANAELMKILRGFTLVPTVPVGSSPIRFIAEGKHATEAWAAYVLMEMAAAGALEKLVQCDCRCGKWLIKVKRTDRFYADSCKVRFHQSDEDFKAKRREEQG